MDRIQELNDILNEPTPLALEQSVKRARSRHKKSRVGRWCGIPVASLAGVAALFVLLVNTSIPFARACGNIPLLKGLATAVAFSPSLKAAVENDYVQIVGEEQTVNGVTMRVEYLIVDKKQVNIFYSVSSDEHPNLDNHPYLLDMEGGQLHALVSWGTGADDTLHKITAEFTDEDVPDAFRLNFKLFPRRDGGMPAGDTVAAFTFDLRFNPAFTEQGETIELNQTVNLDGQTLTVKSVEIYPTHMRLNLLDTPANTAWLRSLEFYLEDGEGNRYDKIKNGISSTGDPDGTLFTPSHHLESSYFGDAEHLTVHITGATWLDKDSEYIELNIADGTATHLPQGVTLGKAERVGDNVNVTLVVQSYNGGTYGVLYDGWLDSDGGHHDVNRIGRSSSFEESHEEEGVLFPAGSFYETFTLKDCTWNNVKLGVSFSRFSTFETPISVDVK